MTDLDVALELAGLADAITLPRFRAADLRVETKPDLSPVSEADRDVEAEIRRHLAQVRPADGVLGEEQGEDARGERRWIIDPIDGTRNYVRGVPVWATLIALEVGGRVTTGVISAPALGQRWWAGRGDGAWAAERLGAGWTERRPIRVSRVRRLEDAYISATDPPLHAGEGMRHRYSALARRCWTARALGDFWSHCLVAEGAIDIAVDLETRLDPSDPDAPVSRLGPWDVAANLVIAEEAGGRLTDLRGEARIDSGHAITTNGLLHEEVLAALNG